MLDRDDVTVLIEHVPGELIALRDSIANAETEPASHVWEHQRKLSEQIKALKDKCGAEAGHSLIIALAGKPGTRRRLMRNGRDERRTCIMCGTEEVGTLATGFLSRFLLRRAKWKFESFNGHITRIFADPAWYFETVSIIRQFSFPTAVVLHHAFPPRLPSSLLADHG